MTSVKSTIARPKGPQSTTITKNIKSLPSSIKHRLQILNTGSTDVYHSEGSKVYTVICIFFVGMSLIGLGTGLVMYASDRTIADLIIIGSIGVFIGIVLLFVAVAFLVKPIIERRQRNRQVATLIQKQCKISVAPGLSGYVYRTHSEINLQKADTPSSKQLYELQEMSERETSRRGTLTVAYPSEDKHIATYDVKVQTEDTVKSIL